MISLTITLLFAAQDKTSWGKIEFTKVGALGAEYKEALKEAAKKNLPVMIFFTCGCATCHTFGEGPCSDGAVADLSKKFLRLLVKGNKELAKKYKAESCPSLVFLDSKGKELRALPKRDLILMKPEDLRKKMEEVVKESGEKKKP